MINWKLLDDLESAAKAATPGPWIHTADAMTGKDPGMIRQHPHKAPIAQVMHGSWDVAADGDFIAAAHPGNVLQLVSMIRYLTTSAAESDMISERLINDAIWGEQNHEPMQWLSILVEEVGEAAKAMNEHHWKGASMRHVRKELVQVAAVAIAAIECIDRHHPESEVR